ncbi:MAG TPA: bifunctional riboflavin kinase/FAD synthetase [Terriglobales bacterium]
MQLLRRLADIPADFGPTIVSVGNFDGLHRAHRKVIDIIVDRARQQGLKSMVVSFEPHPIRILRPDSPFKLITPTVEKIRMLSETGVDAALFLPFTRDLSLMTPHQFAHDILGKALRAKEVHEGYNFHFGHKAEGNVEMLAEFGRELGFRVELYPEMRLRGETVSSSHIRKLVSKGRLSRARHLLARPFSILSTAGRGHGRGTTHTVPTINLSRYEELVPRHGVYITRARIANECFDAVTNVGDRPTFGPDSFAIETHLLNFHPLEIDAETEVEIFFLDRIRDEIKFPSVEALREQIGKDVNRARRYFHLMASHASQSGKSLSV